MKFALFSTALLATGVSCAAIPVNGWYVNAFGGYANITSNVNTSYFGSFSSKLTYNAGYNAGGRIGYKSNPIRYEFEYTYLSATPERFIINNIRQFNVSGRATANLLMANLYYDFCDVLDGIAPFIGGGIGYAFMEKSLSSIGPFLITNIDADRNAFAYQGTAGLTYNFSENFAINAAYRYMATGNTDGGRGTNRIFGKSFQSQMGSAGVIYRFDTATYK